MVKKLIINFLCGNTKRGIPSIFEKEGLQIKHSIVPKSFENNFPKWDKDLYNNIIVI